MAIALDAAVNGGLGIGVTSLTWSHTCTGSDRILFVGAFGDFATDAITGATYAGAAMTLVDKRQITGDRWVYLFYRIAPATGANNVVVSANASIAIGGDSASYTGAKQSGQPDASATNVAGAATSITTSVTTIADNCWTILLAKNNGGGDPSAGTGSTRRAFGNEMGIFDSNAAITPAGAYSMQVTANSSNWAAVMASFAPATAAVATKRVWRMMMGVGT